MSDAQFPRIRQTAIDTADPRGLADFYRQLLGLNWSPGDEPGGSYEKAQVEAGQPIDWVGLDDENGTRVLAFQLVVDLPRPVWPDGNPPQMMHLDTSVPTFADLERHRDRAVSLGAEIISDQSDDPDEALYVFADPSGHPFCIFVQPD
ncbi:VOC family protein [Frondihabitans australicus]|uniref:Catechol 2,3-dioxygenase-like lactoylglutathione lyase family enzyme n=1 Tax=Frondihabitans australicus TaxID=386892 RepID=A0A495IJK6_9MICO|nr:VOC family protein [Frondihabitans australicus]RKR75598.1 catechol 2,3-dioxygenase-like lactoylglutathione lyase family enzyme [Frondihabitans australicus]